MLLTHKDILLELEEMRKSMTQQDDRIDMIYNYLKQFIQDQKTPRTEVGYKKPNSPEIKSKSKSFG